MDARQSRRGKRISLQQEKRAAADIGGRTMAASGALRLGGGADVRVQGKIRLECKFTEKPSYTLKLDELIKLRKQAVKTLEYPVFQFAFRDPSGRMEQYAVVQWDEEKAPFHTWHTEHKSYPLERATLPIYTGQLVRLEYHVREGTGLKSHYFRIMTWAQFLERQEANA